MHNFPVKVKGEEYWISRSLAIMVIPVRVNDDDVYVLVEQRGPGSMDEPNKWCMPCGYLDYDETLQQACARELKEETGIEVKPYRFKILGINSNPSENRQNVTVRYGIVLNENENPNKNKAVGGEKNEISDVRWIKVGTISNNSVTVSDETLNSFDWAFGHDDRIRQEVARIILNF